MNSARQVVFAVRALGPRRAAAPILIAVTVAQAVLEHGGFSLAARVVFVVLAALSAAAAAFAGGRAAARAALHPVVVTLLGLAALGALSALWTDGLTEDALTWALLPGGYALLAAAVLGSSVHGSAARNALIGGLCGAAAVSGLVGLLGAATFSEPQAFRPAGAWRPAGTLEYAPALALLQVIALPSVLRGLCLGGRVAALAAVPAVVAGAVLGLSHSRLAVAMALVVAAATVAAPERTARSARTHVVAALALVVLAGVLARAALGGRVPVGADAQPWRVVAVLVACACAPLAWAGLGRATRRSAPLVLAAAVAALTVAGGVSGFAGSLAPTPAEVTGSAAVHAHHRSRPARNDVLHGRAVVWKASLRAIRRRPLVGHGASAFLPATARLQHVGITAYAHDLPLEFTVELGAAGALLALALYLSTARAVWRARLVPGSWLLIVPAAAFLLANLVDWPWHIAGLGAVWSASTGALPRPGPIPSPPGAHKGLLPPTERVL